MVPLLLRNLVLALRILQIELRNRHLYMLQIPRCSGLFRMRS